ncbi:TIGR03089 family protein [Actinomyces sp. zg296]|uniref:TIGR03089 family protein n=1 Tax=Actinomyces sp. zg296 TaxID=2609289 RepID=UPI0013588BD9|nr:TIGR03089 family protein [Actinomyces sp. zg296]
MNDPLIPLLPTSADGDRPWLIWYAPEERIELTGRVLAMWSSKTAAFLDAEAGPAPLVHCALEPHWRTVTWWLGTWQAGGGVLDAGADGTSTAVAPAVSVAFSPDRLHQDADVQALVARASLALRWPGALPPLVSDGVADLMAHPDSFPALPTAPGAPALIEATGAPGGPGAGRSLDRGALVDSLPPATGPAGATPGTPGAVLIRHETMPAAMRAILAAWRDGRAAVLLAPGADDALATAAARQEGAA